MNAPVPGGCCTTCMLSNNDPSLGIRYDADTTSIKFHGANLAPAFPRFKRNGVGNILCQCDFAIYGPDEAQPKISTLTYTLYVHASAQHCPDLATCTRLQKWEGARSFTRERERVMVDSAFNDFKLC